MSKERAQARALREVARERDRAQAARRRARKDRAQRLRPSLPALPQRRRRRYGAADPRFVGALLLGWAVVQIVIWQLVYSTQARLGLAVLGLAVLPVVTTLSRSHR